MFGCFGGLMFWFNLFCLLGLDFMRVLLCATFVDWWVYICFSVFVLLYDTVYVFGVYSVLMLLFVCGILCLR